MMRTSVTAATAATRSSNHHPGSTTIGFLGSCNQEPSGGKTTDQERVGRGDAGCESICVYLPERLAPPARTTAARLDAMASTRTYVFFILGNSLSLLPPTPALGTKWHRSAQGTFRARGPC